MLEVAPSSRQRHLNLDSQGSNQSPQNPISTEWFAKPAGRAAYKPLGLDLLGSPFPPFRSRLSTRRRFRTTSAPSLKAICVARYYSPSSY
jgi:hypothetical protein